VVFSVLIQLIGISFSSIDQKKKKTHKKILVFMSRVRAYDQKTKNFTPICFNLNVFSLSSICCYFFCLSFQFSPIPDYNYILANKTKKKESNQSIYVLFRVISKKKSKYVYSRLSCTVIVLCDVAYFCFLSNMHTEKNI